MPRSASYGAVATCCRPRRDRPQPVTARARRGPPAGTAAARAAGQLGGDAAPQSGWWPTTTTASPRPATAARTPRRRRARARAARRAPARSRARVRALPRSRARAAAGSQTTASACTPSAASRSPSSRAAGGRRRSADAGRPARPRGLRVADEVEAHGRLQSTAGAGSRRCLARVEADPAPVGGMIKSARSGRVPEPLRRRDDQLVRARIEPCDPTRRTSCSRSRGAGRHSSGEGRPPACPPRT